MMKWEEWNKDIKHNAFISVVFLFWMIIQKWSIIIGGKGKCL